MKTLTFLLFILNLLAQAKEVKIDFNKEFEGGSGIIYLGDIAEIDAPLEIKEALSQVQLGFMPHPGRNKKLYTNTLKRFKINPIVSLEQVEFSGAKVVNLINKGQELKPDLQEKLILQYVQSQLNFKSDSTSVKIKSKLRTIYLPLGEYELVWATPANFDSRGGENITLEVHQEQKKIAEYRFHILIQQWKQVLKSAKRIPKGNKIVEEDLTFSMKEITHDGREFITSKEELIGSEARRTLGANRVLFHREFAKPTLVEVGQDIKLKVKLGQSYLEVAGVARENGTQGELIRVINKSSRVALQGRVISEGVVEILN